MIPNPEIGIYGLILLMLVSCGGNSPQLPTGDVQVPTLQSALADLHNDVNVDRSIEIQGIPATGDACINCNPCPIYLDTQHWDGWQIKTAIYAQFGMCVGGGIYQTPDAIVDENQTIRNQPKDFSKYSQYDLDNYQFAIGLWQRGF